MQKNQSLPIPTNFPESGGDHLNAQEKEKDEPSILFPDFEDGFIFNCNSNGFDYFSQIQSLDDNLQDLEDIFTNEGNFLNQNTGNDFQNSEESTKNEGNSLTQDIKYFQNFEEISTIEENFLNPNIGNCFQNSKENFTNEGIYLNQNTGNGFQNSDENSINIEKDLNLNDCILFPDDQQQIFSNIFKKPKKTYPLSKEAEIFKKNYYALFPIKFRGVVRKEIIKKYHKLLCRENREIRCLNRDAERVVNVYFKTYADQADLIIQELRGMIANGLNYMEDHSLLTSRKK